MTTSTAKAISFDRVDTDPAQDDADFAIALMRDIAQRSLTATRAAAADPADAGQSLPLPLGDAERVTIARALEAAFFQLEQLKKRANGELPGETDPLDWSEEMLEPIDPLVALMVAKR
jgi:hypothetical protein